MHSKILAFAAGSVFAITSFGADALPAGQVAGVSAIPHVTLVAEGCGPGFERGPAGGCRRIGVIVRRPVVVVPARPVVVVRPARPVVVVRPVRPRCGIRVPGVAIVTPC